MNIELSEIALFLIGVALGTALGMILGYAWAHFVDYLESRL